MDPQSNLSMTSVLKTLSAVRATLSDDEQAVLDGFVVSYQDEVQAHSLTNAATAAITGAVAASPDEVRAHAQVHIVFDSAIEEYRLVA